MTFRALDANGDFTFGKGLANYAQGNQAIALDIRTYILSWKGDCCFDNLAGIDWTNRLEVGQEEALRAEIENAILQRFGVVGLNTFTAVFSPRSRALSLTYNIDTVYSRSFTDLIQEIAGLANA